MQELHPIDKAIAAHARWKSRLRQVIESGESEVAADDVRPENRCEFGRWLADRPAEQRETAHYKTVRDLHARFHIEAAHVLELALAGHRQQAEAAMAIGSDFAGVSAKLTASMTAWKKALGDR
ncbi:MAG: CZB domain-containing protein [Isosphaeraceae bacterium]